FGCGHDKAAPSAGSGSAAPTAAAPAAPPAPTVEIIVNDLSLGTVQPTLLAGWPRLDSLVPGDARRFRPWERVSLQGANPAPTELSHPSTAYPDLVPALFPGDGGSASFGMFDPVELARRGKPAMREDNLKTIRITFARDSNRGQNDDG